MPEKTLSFFDSTIEFVKPVAYDLLEVSVIEDNKVRKIMHDAQATFLISIVYGAKIIYGLLDVVMARLSWMGGCGELCAEGGKRYTQAPYLSAGYSDFPKKEEEYQMTEIRISGVVEITKRRPAIGDMADIHDDIVDFGSAQEYRRDH